MKAEADAADMKAAFDKGVLDAAGQKMAYDDMRAALDKVRSDG